MKEQEYRMIAYLADKLWDVMTIPELYDQFTDRERDTVNNIRNCFDVCYCPGSKEEWNKTE